MVNRASVVTFACALLAAAALSSFAAEPLRDRRTFAEAMNKVKEGMSEAEVISLVGKPDDVRRRIGNSESLTVARFCAMASPTTWPLLLWAKSASIESTKSSG